MTKKINSLIALLLLATTFNSYSMEPQRPPQWTVLTLVIGDIILGKRPPEIGKLREYVVSLPAIPEYMQKLIIQLITLYVDAQSLKGATGAINSLAQVDDQFNRLINIPDFCLYLIKHLAKKFNRSDQEAAEALQTHEAKRRLDLQNQLYTLCENPHNSISLEDLYHADLTFTYTSWPQTLLMQAITFGSMAIIRQLLNAGADPEIANNDGLTPLQAAQQTGNQEIIDLIQNAINKKQNTALIKAAQKNNCLMIKELLSNGANINTTDSDGNTALLWAVDQEHIDAVQCLVGNPNIAIDQHNNEEDTALMLALVKKNKLIIQLLLDAGADPELGDSRRHTPLKIAQKTEDAEIISLISKAILKKHGVVNIFAKTQK